MASEVIYARVPTDLKAAVERYATSHELSLTGSVTELLVKGVEAVDREATVGALQERIDALERDLAAARIACQEETLHSKRQEEERKVLDRAAQTWAARANQQVGTCQKCAGVISGYDLFVTGQCPNCGNSVTSMMSPQEKSGLDQKELLVMLGAVGFVLGIMAISRGK